MTFADGSGQLQCGEIPLLGGDLSWMVDYLGPNPVVDELIPQIGATLAGSRTFGGDDPHKGGPTSSVPAWPRSVSAQAYWTKCWCA
jgi:hypothetical protein